MRPSLVSILIPCYNAAPWLAQTLEAALAQTWLRKEVIVVNDGSTDNSLEVAGVYERSGVRVIDQFKRGAAAARNTALAVASGEFIQYLDADDLLAPDKIERQMGLFVSEANNASLSSCAWARFHKGTHDARFIPQPNWRDLTGVEFLQLLYETGSMMHPAAWLTRRTVLDRAGPWDETLSLNDDGEYFARVVLVAQRIVFCSEARTYYRSSLTHSLSSHHDRKALESLFRSVELTIQHLLASGPSPRTRAAAAYGWKWLAFELYPDAPDLARAAERNSEALGGSHRPFPAGGRFQVASKVFGSASRQTHFLLTVQLYLSCEFSRRRMSARNCCCVRSRACAHKPLPTALQKYITNLR